MKRFLPIFILFGFLFGQDVLLLKSGKNYKGRFITKDGEKIIFRLEGEKNINAFSINDVDIIMTGDGDFYYPFDMPIKKESSSFGKDVLYLKSGEFHKGVFIKKLGNDILFQQEVCNVTIVFYQFLALPHEELLPDLVHQEQKLILEHQ